MEMFMFLLAIRHYATAITRGKIYIAGDALGVWFGMVWLKAPSPKVNNVAKELGPCAHFEVKALLAPGHCLSSPPNLGVLDFPVANF